MTKPNASFEGKPDIPSFSRQKQYPIIHINFMKAGNGCQENFRVLITMKKPHVRGFRSV